MTYLVESSLLVRLANPSDALYPNALTKIENLHRLGESLCIAPQNLIEFRSVATRPLEVNGLGLTATETEAKAVEFEETFRLLAETPEIFPAWKALVQAVGVTGKQVHDARLVAICHVYGISHILTFNVRHFARLALFGPGVTIVDPISAV